MIGGPNGSGKSTLIKLLLEAGADLGRHFNADDLARMMSGDPVDVARRAQALVRDGRDAALRAGEDYSWETVMSHPSHVEHLVEARRRGYRVRVIYVALASPYANMARVEERVQAGGHDVPLEAIRRRYFRSLENLSGAIVISDEAEIYDNSLAFDPFREVASWRDQNLAATLEPMPDWFLPAYTDLANAGMTDTRP